MLNLALSQAVKITKVANYTATGTTDVTGSAVDMAGYGGCVFVAIVGSSAADVGMKAQQGAASGMGDAADLEGSLTLLDGTQKVVVLDINNPEERYLRPVIKRTTTTTVEAVLAIQYRPNEVPISNTTAAQVADLLERPAEGTA